MKSEGKSIVEVKNAVKIDSDKLFLLRNYRWLVTKNSDSINYSLKSSYDKHFGCYMTTKMYEDKLFHYHPKLERIRDLKEKYISFNRSYAGKPMEAAEALDELIKHYYGCDEHMFRKFAGLLTRFREPIINSFVMLKKTGVNGKEYEARLSNGPIESINRKAKDMNRLSRGYTNFDHLRNRFLYATRKSSTLDGRDNNEQK